MEGLPTTKISFKLQNQTYAIDSLKVRNILPFEDNITSVPNTETYVLGVINLHGNILPVVDMRMVLGIDEKEITRDTSIVIVSPEDKIETQFGIMVDLVHEVFEIEEDKVKPSPFTKGMGMIQHFEGTIQQKDQFIHLMDIMHLNSQLDSKVIK